MDRVKYVVTRYAGAKAIFIFPAFVEHFKFAKHMGFPLSAGFVDMESKNCYGKSETLKLQSNPETDNMLLRNLLK